jgi:hypothetical protein
LTYSVWSDDKKDAHTTALGFLIQYDSKNCPSAEVLQEINSDIAIENNIDTTDIPCWKPLMTSSSISLDGKFHRNLSCDITCKTKDAQQLLCLLLQKTFTKPKRPYSLKCKQPQLFPNLVDYQYDYCADLMTIAVEGIPRQHIMCVGFNDILKTKHPNIVDIYQHKNKDTTNSQGEIIGWRWNLMISNKHFKACAPLLTNNIQEDYNAFIQATNPPAVDNTRFITRVTSKIKYDNKSDSDSTATLERFICFLLCYFINSIL